MAYPSATTRARDALLPVFASVLLLAMAHNWAGITDAYFSACHWVALQLSAAVVHATAPATDR
jgi:hypothetical protein